MMTARVDALAVEMKRAALAEVQTFDAFTPDNDPHGEHDFGSFELAGEKFFFKVDYFDLNLELGSEDPADPGITRVFAAAAKHNMPVNLLAWGRLEQAEQLAARNPNTSLIIDHLALQQPRVPPAPKDAWEELPKVLKLAAYKNVSIKVSGACTLSHEPFPFKDIWDPLSRVFDAFSLDRCMWGTDWTRAKAVVDYKPAVDAFRVTDRLTDSDRAKLMGGSLTKIYNWAPSKAKA